MTYDCKRAQRLCRHCGEPVIVACMEDGGYILFDAKPSKTGSFEIITDDVGTWATRRKGRPDLRQRHLTSCVALNVLRSVGNDKRGTAKTDLRKCRALKSYQGATRATSAAPLSERQQEAHPSDA